MKNREEKKILVVDTVSEMSSVAVGDSDLVWRGERKQSSELLVQIEKIMKKNKLSFSSLEGVGVIIGPGSYTGIRIGVSVVNTIAQLGHIPIKSMDTLLAQALVYFESRGRMDRNIREEKNEMVSLLSAGFGRVYARKYSRNRKKVEPVTNFFHGEAVDFLKKENRKTAIVGEINDELKKILFDEGFSNIIFYDQDVEKSRSKILVDNFCNLSPNKKNIALPKYI